MLEIDVKTNLPDFKAQLLRFGVDFERKTMRLATAAAGNVFKKAVIAFAPVLKKPDRRKRNPRIAGTLKKAIYRARSKKSTRGAERYVVSFRKGYKAGRKGRDAFYGKFLESGWIPRGPHQKSIGKRYASVLRRRGAGGKITEYAFIKPAYNFSRVAALDAFENRIEKAINKENKKRGFTI